MTHRRWAAVAWLMLTFTGGVVAVAAQEPVGGCLYAVSVGGRLVAPCVGDDPLALATNPEVGRLSTVFEIAPEEVQFRGCAGALFAARENARRDGGGPRFTIEYPSDFDGDFVAPVAHELAHIHQMREAGGFSDLRREIPQSRRVELGADYLTGVVFAMTGFRQVRFQTNLQLIGKYFEDDERAHGTPAQRTAAFRYGFNSDNRERDIRQAHEDFQDNEYGHVQRM